MKCKFCGKTIDEGSMFCGYCGKQQPKVKNCVKCGQEIGIDGVFCGYCGASQSAEVMIHKQNESQLTPDAVEENVEKEIIPEESNKKDETVKADDEAITFEMAKNNVNSSSNSKPQLTSFTTKNKSNINIHGYTQWFAATPDVKILVNGQVVGKVAKDEIFQIQLDAPCQLKFECNLRSTTINMDPSIDSDVYLSFDRLSGSLIANKNNDTDSIDKPSIGLDIVSFLIPIVGLVLYFVKKENFPQSAKSYLICAICGFVLGLAISYL